MKVSSLQIRTPEGIVFSQLLAGPVARFLAWSVDLLAMGALMTIVSYFVFLFRLVSPGFGSALSIVEHHLDEVRASPQLILSGQYFLQEHLPALVDKG